MHRELKFIISVQNKGGVEQHFLLQCVVIHRARVAVTVVHIYNKHGKDNVYLTKN